jgi:hypothetical protein
VKKNCKILSKSNFGHTENEWEINEKTSMSIRHNFGKKGSTYISSFLSAVIASTLNRECAVTESDDSVTLSFAN